MKSCTAAFILLFVLNSCISESSSKPTVKKDTHSKTPKKEASPKVIADAATIMSRKQVPVLCYHHIRSLRPGESSRMYGYNVPVATFQQQIKTLADSGYHTITPDQYYDYLTTGEPLPTKPIMITFDDTDEEQYTIGAAELNKYGFKGVYFIMTISIGRPRYMSKEQLKELSDSGHVIAAHTWDHHNVKEYGEQDWDKQFATPKQKLEAITGKEVSYFAYPFGVWKPEAIPELKKRGYKGAFQLSMNKRDSLDPLFTLRRMIVPGNWDIGTMQKWMKINFHE
jgi:peptidoglycan/xylan/chitin deacetylase (PgdA/CDA1 family)